jgi:LuxR family maltose regulon positive regulatory protein
MVMPLLTTKLYIPPIRRELVPRPRLIERLNAGLDRKLTLVSAPAGFGKTTLLSEWIAGCAQTESKVCVAWLSLDGGDNDPLRFWTYFIAALQTVQPALGRSALAALQSSQSPSVDALLTGLINEIAEIPGPLAFVLDDFYCVEAEPIHDALAFLLDHLPPQMHLIIATRSDPPLPLSRLRGRGQLAELRTADLRFAADEAAAFLNSVMGLGLSPADVAALEERTEGWIVGLQMASLAMQARLSMGGQSDLSGFIKAFSGSHRFVLDYLVEEVLAQQSPDVQEFLLKTSILERMTAPLCDAVTARDDSQTILAYLEGANLFLVPLDDERHWYRYHQLFADLLRSRLQLTQPDGIPALHCRASEWYGCGGQIVEAVGHALLAGDVEWIEQLVAGNALAVIYHGELATVARWLDALPAELARSRPRLCVAQAWTLAHAGQVDSVEPLLGDAERALARPDEYTDAPLRSAAEGQQIAGHIAAIRAYVAALKGDWSRAADLAREALDCLPEADLTVWGWTALLLGCELRSGGDFAAATLALAEARVISRAAGDSHLEVDVLWEQAVLQSGRGQLRRVMSTCEEALQIADEYTRRAGRQLPVTGYTYAMMSHVLCEWNDLGSALRYAREGIDLCMQWGQADALAQGYSYLARVLHATGDTAGALDTIQEAKHVTRGLNPWYAITAGAHEARIRLAQGDVAAATRWLQGSGLSADGELTIEYCISYLSMARILMAQDRLDETLGLLMRLFKIVEAAGAMGPAIGIFVLQALVLQAQGEGEQAPAALERALSLAEPEGYVRTFIDEGEPMTALLRQAAARGIAVEYAGKLLSEWAKEATRAEPAGESPALPAEFEPLTEREMEILRLLAIGLSNREIAEQLFLAVGTVKKYTSNIYGKLSVHSRTQAAAKARELGLL